MLPSHIIRCKEEDVARRALDWNIHDTGEKEYYPVGHDLSFGVIASKNKY